MLSRGCRVHSSHPRRLISLFRVVSRPAYKLRPIFISHQIEAFQEAGVFLDLFKQAQPFQDATGIRRKLDARADLTSSIEVGVAESLLPTGVILEACSRTMTSRP